MTRVPQRYLAPELAEAVAQAKLATGLTWRQIGEQTGVTHSHLVMISKGYRVPSRRVVELMAQVLPIDEEALEGLREVAAVPWHYPSGDDSSTGSSTSR